MSSFWLERIRIFRVCEFCGYFKVITRDYGITPNYNQICRKCHIREESKSSAKGKEAKA